MKDISEEITQESVPAKILREIKAKELEVRENIEKVEKGEE